MLVHLVENYLIKIPNVKKITEFLLKYALLEEECHESGRASAERGFINSRTLYHADDRFTRLFTTSICEAFCRDNWIVEIKPNNKAVTHAFKNSNTVHIKR